MHPTRRTLIAAGLAAAHMTGTALIPPSSAHAAASAAEPDAPPQWDPSQTWVLAIGVITYPDGEHWPSKGRCDVDLVAALRACGVPADQIKVLKDSEATLEGVDSALDALMTKAPPSATLWFYYAGHGQKDKAGTSQFVLYDKPWPMPDLYARIERSFKGKTALLFADCCYSGSLGLEALLRAGRVEYGILTSSLASSLSTGDWTFTECLIASLKGTVPRENGRTGRLSFTDVAHFAEREMALTEEQLSTFIAANGFNAGFTLGPAAAPPPGGSTHYIEAKWTDGKWYRAAVEKTEGDRVFVRWLFSPRWPNEWVDRSHTRPLAFKRLAPGTRVKVEWDNTWYPAEVLAERWGLHLVHYDGFAPVWDEWVAPKRIRSA